MLHELLLDLLLSDVLGVLGGDHHSVHALGDGAAADHLVLARYLSLAVRAHPGAHAVLADLGVSGGDSGR